MSDGDVAARFRRPRVGTRIALRARLASRPARGTADRPVETSGERMAQAGAGRWRAVVRGLGELLVTAGLVVLLFVGYEVYVTDLLNDRRQAELAQEVGDAR